MENEVPQSKSPMKVILIVAGVAVGAVVIGTIGITLAVVLGLTALGNSLESKFEKVGHELQPAGP